MKASFRFFSVLRNATSILSLVLLTISVGCATFGITPAAREDGREGRDYAITVRAWDKKADNLNVMFKYRVNGGAWKDKQGQRNGALYEAVIPGSELPAGTLEYYASMQNSKGDTVSSTPVQVRILSFAEAKAKATAEYAARLSDGGTAGEFLYNENAEFKLKIGGTAVPAQTWCEVQTAGSAVRLDSSASGNLRTAVLNAPVKGNTLSWHWTARWTDAEFGEITVRFPAEPKSAPVLDQAALEARIKKDFKTALIHSGPVSGTWLEPPKVRADLKYAPLLARLSKGPQRVELVLRGGSAVRFIPMTDSGKGAYTAVIPSEELEQGAVTYTFRYTDTFLNLGMTEAVYPEDKPLAVAYRTKEELAKDRVAEIRKLFVHAPPEGALEGQPLSFTVKLTDPGLQVKSLTFAGGSAAFGRGIPFIQDNGLWIAALPATLARPGFWNYALRAVVVDSRFGDLELTLPAENSGWAVAIQSLAELRTVLEAELVKALSHAKPEGYAKGQGLVLNLNVQGAVPGDSASVFYRPAGAANYREIKGTAAGSGFAFALGSTAASADYFQYYFTLRRADPRAGSLSATLRDTGGGTVNDFVIAAKSPAPAAGTAAPAPAAPVTTTPAASPPPPSATAAQEPPAMQAQVELKDIESFYSGPGSDKGSIRFYVRLKNELGLYEVSVFARVSGKDKDFKEFPMDRKGKEYSYAMDTGALPAGTAVDFYYGLKRKGIDGIQTLYNNGQPFQAIAGDERDPSAKTPGKSANKN